MGEPRDAARLVKCARVGEFDDDTENSLSLAAIEVELKPKVGRRSTRCGDAYKRLRRLQDQDLEFKLKTLLSLLRKERRYKKLKNGIIRR